MEPISRRSFIAAASGAVASRGFINFRQVSRPIIGSGEFRYEVIHDWLGEPMHLKWGDTHGVAKDSQGRIYIAHTVHERSVSRDAICVFDPMGRFISSWGSVYAGGAHGLDIRREGREDFIYHCDIRRRRVVKTDLVGKIIWEKGFPGASGAYAQEEQWCPTNVAFAPNGDLFVADGYGSSYVHKYTKNGEFVSIVARPGSGKGEVQQPHGLWVDDRGQKPRLAVADRANRRIQYFDLDGNHLGFVTDGIRLPCHFKTKDGFLLVPDLESVVTILDRNDKVVAQLGDGHPSNLRNAPRESFINGKFIHPHSAMWLNKRDILVVEWVPVGRITLLRNVNYDRS